MNYLENMELWCVYLLLVLRCLNINHLYLWCFSYAMLSSFFLLQDYITESENLVLLHDQISDCDNILSQMETVLTGFQVIAYSHLLWRHYSWHSCRTGCLKEFLDGYCLSWTNAAHCEVWTTRKSRNSISLHFHLVLLQSITRTKPGVLEV